MEAEEVKGFLDRKERYSKEDIIDTKFHDECFKIAPALAKDWLVMREALEAYKKTAYGEIAHEALEEIGGE